MSFDKRDCKILQTFYAKDGASQLDFSSHPTFCLVKDVAVPGSDWWRAKMSQVTMSPHPLPKTNSRSAVSKHGSNTNQVPKHLLLPPEKNILATNVCSSSVKLITTSPFKVIPLLKLSPEVAARNRNKHVEINHERGWYTFASTKNSIWM